MKTILKILFFLLCVVVFFAVQSCRSSQTIADRKCANAQLKYEKAAYRWGCPLVQQSDTILQQITIRETHDTTIYMYIKGDTVREVDTVIVVNGIAQSPKHRLDTEFAYSISYVQDGKLYHILVQKESVISKTIEDAVKKESKIEYKTIIKTIKETTNHLKSWQVCLMWLGGFMILQIILIFAYTIYRIVKK